MADIVISEFLDEEALFAIPARHSVLYDATLVDRPDALRAEIRDCLALIVRNRTQVRGDFLKSANRLKVVGRLGVGLDNIDLAACAARQIVVHPASGANDLSVAEYVVTAALMLLRRAWFSTADVASGAWPRSALMGRELSGKTLGLVGFGAIAKETARRAHALGMRIIAHDPYATDHAFHAAQTASRPLKTLLAEADVISLHIPLTGETRNLIDAAAIAGMKPGAIVINAARGGVIDEAALVAALKSGRLGGAALDVFEKEPVTAENGAIFADAPNLILTPHIAGVTQESNVRVSHVTIANVLRTLDGLA